MKLLFFNSSVGSGGAERVLSNLANGFAEKEGYSVTIATYNNSVNDFYTLNKNIKRIRFGVPVGTNIFSKIIKRIQKLYTIRKIVKEEKPDVVLPLIVYTNMEVLMACLGLNVKILVAEHNNYFAVKSKLTRILRLITYKYATKVVLLTRRDKLIYDKYLSNTIVINNPIVLNTSKNDFINSRTKTILCVGRLMKVKQFDHAIKAFSKLHKIHPDWKLLIAGSGVELENLKKCAQNLKLDNQVEFLGNVKTIENLYKSCGIFVLCSEYEGLPMVIGEAMLGGIPVVSYDCPTGPSEFIDNEINGLLVEHNNIDELAQKIESLIDNQEKITELTRNAKIKIQEFSIENIINKWEYQINATK